MSADDTRSEFRWVLVWAIAIVLLASVPYLWGTWVAPPGYQFLGLTHNIDDGAVYFSWMRQVADGSTTFRNLFTSEPTHARQFNVLILAMGSVARFTSLPPIIALHLFRFALGILLILVLWCFSKLFLQCPNERQLFVLLVGLSAGVGWLIPGSKAPVGSVDVWQPEAITFLSIYLNPLFIAGLILMVGSLYFLILAQRTGQVRHAICAGLSMLLLANIHTYDILTVASVWVCYVIVLAITERHFPTRTVLLSALAALIAVPAIAYQYHLYQIDEVFRTRANSPAPSPVIWSYFTGYGLVLVGAIVGAAIAIRRRGMRPGSQFSTLSLQLILVWSVIGFILPYIPVGQQRKLVMGLHIPLCILCAYALSVLAVRLPRSVGRGLVLAFVLFAAGSNVAFLSRDMSLLSVGRTVTHYAPFMSNSELRAMSFLRHDADPKRAVYGPPGFALFTPAFTGHEVYYGHWSETPDYADKLRAWLDFVNPDASPADSLQILQDTGARYYVSTYSETAPPPSLIGSTLFPVYRNGSVTIYQVKHGGEQ